MFCYDLEANNCKSPTNYIFGCFHVIFQRILVDCFQFLNSLKYLCIFETLFHGSIYATENGLGIVFYVASRSLQGALAPSGTSWSV